ncbi:integrase catalytic domain-containing protein [Trichonephila clavipes]|uniref:Integrase catalytic domain-containing protein n=1 Tax=Trichonephila clavipes TaxID=2585209 RepID=A0A8X6W1G1_TRICX|nr:integrase catalytic domain-containing protein [Trichonephila clavipes]
MLNLPDLPLPTFSGKFQEFEQFKLQFMNLIGNNPSLNEVQKLCYLKGALKNEASLIQSDQDTFDSLMKALEVRYENTRALVDIQIAEILSINKLNSKNPSQIRSIIDKLESIEDEPRNLNSQAKFCEEHFVNNHCRDESGQYIVQMTFLKEPNCLGESKQTAIYRLNSLWRKLDANPNLKQLYREFIHEYLDMGHMEQLSDESEPRASYYMTHHGVLSPDSKSK